MCAFFGGVGGGGGRIIGLDYKLSLSDYRSVYMLQMFGFRIHELVVGGLLPNNHRI